MGTTCSCDLPLGVEILLWVVLGGIGIMLLVLIATLVVDIFFGDEF